MKHFFYILVVFSLMCGACGRQTSHFKPLKPDLRTLPGGMELLSLPDHEFPTVQLYLYIRGGSVYDPQGKEGLASLAMQVLRQGGSIGRSAPEVDEALDFAGISLSMGSSVEFTHAMLSLHRKDMTTGLDILLDLLKKPAFDPERFEIAKTRMIESLKREMEDPLTVAYRKFPPLVYGEQVAWGRSPTPQSVEKITLEDIKKFYSDFLMPGHILIAASGDLTTKELEKMIRERIEGWPPPIRDLPPIPPLAEEYSSSVTFVSKKGLTQSTILVGHLGSRRENPDKFALVVLNYILGGGGSLTSRLGEDIRSSAGKAYAVWSHYGFEKDFGIFKAVAQTALKNTEWVIKRIEELIGAMVTSPNFTDAEIQRAKQTILHSLFFDFETRFSQVKELAKYRLWGYPENYLEIFQKGIDGVTREDLERVAKKYLHPKDLKVLIVSDEGTLGDQVERLKDLSKAGRVERILLE